MVLIAQASESAGPAAVITAAGGVFISLATVYLNSRKQSKATAEVESSLQAEVERLRGEVALLTKRLIHAEEAKIERDRLMDIMQAYGGRKLRKRLIEIDLGGSKSARNST